MVGSACHLAMQIIFVGWDSSLCEAKCVGFMCLSITHWIGWLFVSALAKINFKSKNFGFGEKNIAQNSKILHNILILWLCC